MDKTPRITWSGGHGLDSRVKGKVDPGAQVLGHPSEAAVALSLCKDLHADCQVLFAGHPGAASFLRDQGVYYLADDFAADNACDTFIEVHTNATKPAKVPDGKEIGCEVLYEDIHDIAACRDTSAALAVALDLPNRGAKRNTGIAVLNPHPGMVQLLVELFFGTDADDVRAWNKYRHAAELAILNAQLKRWGWRTVKHLPRKWGPVRRAWYRRNYNRP